jgi:DNA-directed RNA polymerase beta' subunit
MSYSEISYVGFSIASDADNKKRSVGEVTTHEIFNTDGKPVMFGVYDAKQGPASHTYRCESCGKGREGCPGHQGHMQSKVCLIQPIAINDVRKWLVFTCFACGNLCIDMNKITKFPFSKRLGEAASDVVGSCPKCGASHPKISKDTEDHITLLITVERKTGNKTSKIYPDQIRKIFERINVDQALKISKTIPTKLIISTLVFPSVIIRPGTMSMTAGSQYGDITNLLQHIVKRNTLLPDNINFDSPIEPETARTIQNYEQLYYDLVLGTSATSTQGKRSIVTSNRPVKSVLKNISGKRADIRGALLSGRVLFVARATISGNNAYKIYELGLPLKFARELQKEEIVNEWNRNFLTTVYLNGRKQYPGSTYVIRKSTGEQHDVAAANGQPLEIGDTIFRDIISGDILLFNRAPTLEISNIGAHVAVVIMDPSILTLQFNVSACDGYKADFDGDAMLVWAARTIPSTVEAMILSIMIRHYISSRTSSPLNGEVLDAIIGLYELTRDGIKLSKGQAMALFARVPHILLNKEEYTGHEIMNLLLEKTPINYSGTPTSFNEIYVPYIKYNPAETKCVIKNGKMISGVLDKKSIGSRVNGSIYHIIGREYGSKQALDSIYEHQQVALKFLLLKGTTVGAYDLVLPKAAIMECRKVIEATKLRINQITAKMLRREIIPPINSTVKRRYEDMILNALVIPDGEMIRPILSNINTTYNGLFKMNNVGSKGTMANITHIIGGIGKTVVSGSITSQRFGFARTSPHFPRFSTDPLTFGFIDTCYINGYRSIHLFPLAEYARSDFITKALATARSGYFARRIIMSTQSIIVNNLRMSMRHQKCIQFMYSDNGCDTRELEKVSLLTMMMSDAELITHANLETKNSDLSSVVAAMLKQMKEDRNKIRDCMMTIESTNMGEPLATSILMPFNIKNILARVESQTTQVDDNTIIENCKLVNELCFKMPYKFSNNIQYQRRTKLPDTHYYASWLPVITIRMNLTPKVCASYTTKQIKYICDMIEERYSVSLVPYGEAVGTLAGQAIAQPATQYNLDSVGRSTGKGTTDSQMVQLDNLYNCKDLPLTTGNMRMTLVPSINTIEKAKEVAASIEYLVFSNFVIQYDILIESKQALMYPPYVSDKIWIADHAKLHPLIKQPGDVTNWCVRFIIDKPILVVVKAIRLETVINKLRLLHPGLHIVHTAETSKDIIIRAWIKSSLLKKTSTSNITEEERVNMLITDILSTPIRGIPNILEAVAEKTTKYEASADGSLQKVDRFVVSTVGSNIEKICQNTNIDATTVISSHMGDTFNVYGIEAARNQFIKNTRTIMSDTTPNIQHIMIFGDNMSSTGKMTSIERGGIGAREPNNTLLRIATGDPIRTAINAAMNASINPIYGIAASRLIGETPRIGTLYNNLIIDENFVKANTKSIGSILDDM